MKWTIMIGVLAISSALFAAEREYLWPKEKMPNRQPHQVAKLTCDKENGTEPYIEWYDVPEGGLSTDACVIMISGGGYSCQCDIDYVKNQWPKALNEAGVRVVNLVHRTPRPNGLPIHQSAWEDGQRAVRLVRSQAAKRGFNPEKIGVISMSAGSHLATLLAVSSQTPAYKPIDDLDKVPCHINYAMPFAIAYALTDGIGCANTRDGNAIDVKLDSCFKFDWKTAPMCMSHGGVDPYSPSASTMVYRKLREMKIPAEVHLYPDKSHGMFGLPRAIEFMRQMGFLGEVGSEVALEKRYDKTYDGFATHEAKKNVWPDGKMPNVQEKMYTPTLQWHIPTNLTTKAIQIVWSGGAYCWNSPDSFEVTPLRRYLNEKGMTVVTVLYRSPRPQGNLAKHTLAWQDVQRVIRIVRSEAKARGLDPNRIGVMGSSAGGHLALMAATSAKSRAYWPIDDIDKIPCNVQWSVNIYPAYALTDGADGENAERGNPDSARLVPEFAFDPLTPPMLFIHGDADGYSAMGSVKIWEQLRRMGIQGEVHTLAMRYHCFQNRASEGTGSYTWLDRIWEFLSAKGFNN